jgi:hypothetical protein
MLTQFLKANVGDFLDIEASEGDSGDGQTTDSDKEGMLPRPKIVLTLISYEQERMGSFMRKRTRTGARKTWNRQKKTTMINVPFIIHVLFLV